MEKKQVKVAQFKDELNAKQMGFFEELKKKVIDALPTIIPDPTEEQYNRYTEENQMVRLLWAREYKVDKAFEMWKKWINWRLDFRADYITEEEVRAELKSGKAFWHGYDKLGNPVLVVKVKYHRPGVSTQEVVLRHFLYLLEEGIQKCEAAGTGKISVLWDREGFERKNFDNAIFDTFKKLNQIMQDNYAERLSTIYILHPNWFFKTVFAIVKVFLSDRTKSKITLVNKNTDLLKHFEPSQLLIEHGGTSPYQFVYEEKTAIQDQPSEALKPVDLEEPAELANSLQEKENKSMTEEDLLKFEEEMREDSKTQADKYDIDSLSSSMFNKEIIDYQKKM